MVELRTIFAAAASPDPLLGGMVPFALVLAIFYFILIMPMKNKQKKLDELQKALKAGDKVIVTPGIFGTVVGVEDDALSIKIADQTKIKVLKSAVAALQGSPETEKK
jgi:preprotein translocase subunit YajC